jgi:hypothetical protein
MEQLPSEADILARLEQGEGLKTICGSAGAAAFRRRIRADVAGLASRYARARSIGLDAIAEQMAEIAADDKRDANSRRVHVDTLKWLLSKLRPDKYGDISRTEITGAGGEPLSVTVSYDDRPAKVALSVQPKLLAARGTEDAGGTEDADGTEDD